MKIRLYLDEDTMDKDLAHALRIRGVDVVTAFDIGMIRRADSDHLAVATQQERSLYSFNVRDYQLLHTQCLAATNHHAGIILAQQQKYSIGEQMRRLLKLIAERSAEEMADTLAFLSQW